MYLTCSKKLMGSQLSPPHGGGLSWWLVKQSTNWQTICGFR